MSGVSVLGGELPPEADGFVVGVHHRLYHALLRNWRHERGLTQKQLARMCGLSEQAVAPIERLQMYPNDTTADALADVTGIARSDLFPGWLKEWIGKTPTTYVSEHVVTEHRLAEVKGHPALTTTLDDSLDTTDTAAMAAAVRAAVDTLTPREQVVIAARFGLDDKPQILQEIADQLHVSSERVHQIEAKAMRKLRSRERSTALRPFVVGERDPGGKWRPPSEASMSVCTACGVCIDLTREPGYIIDERPGRFHEACAKKIVAARGRLVQAAKR